MDKSALQEGKWQIGLTAGLALLCLAFPEGVDAMKWYLIIGLVAIIGIPHGASDLMIWINLQTQRPTIRNQIVFLTMYLVLVSIFVVFWFYFPFWGLLFFLLISGYHFGQSNFVSYQWQDQWSRFGLYFMWGFAVIFLPIVLDMPAAIPVLDVLIGEGHGFIEVLDRDGSWIALCLMLLSLSYIAFSHYLSPSEKMLEICKAMALMFLFFSGGLWLSFIWYFTVWHSFDSFLDQFRFFSNSNEQYSLFDLLKGVFPFSLGALLLIGAFIYFTGDNTIDPSAIAHFFIILAALTLPHMILMDRLYDRDKV